jgi:hypothetical protein
MNFSKRFADICEEIKRTIPELKPRVMYNIHKRSLPVGIDQPIMFGLTKEDADWMLAKRLHTKICEDLEGISKIVYYDIVKDNGELSGIYDNPAEFVREN